MSITVLQPNSPETTEAEPGNTSNKPAEVQDLTPPVEGVASDRVEAERLARGAGIDPEDPENVLDIEYMEGALARAKSAARAPLVAENCELKERLELAEAQLRSARSVPVLRVEESVSITREDIKTALVAARRKLGRTSNPKKLKDALYIGRALDGVPLSEDPGENQDIVLGNAIHAIMRQLPHDVPALYVAEMLASSRSDLPTDVLCQAVDQVRASLAAKSTTLSRRIDREGFEINMYDGRVSSSPHNAKLAIEKLNVDFRYEQLSDRMLLNGAYASDIEVDKLRFEIHEQFGFLVEKDLFWSIVRVLAHENSFHPVIEYLDGLPAWDGTGRVETWLTDAGAPDTPYVRAVSRIVLVAAVRRVRHPGCKFDEMLILESPQGMNKSTAIKMLCPVESMFCDNFRISTDTKKNIEQTSGKWIIEAGELRGMADRDHRDLKAYLSSTSDEARMSYDRAKKYVPRQFIIIGTTNDSEYLKDHTGDRRYWPVRIQKFDLEKLIKERDQLWAEAAYLESQGESIRLDPSLWEAAGAEQRKRRYIDHTEIVLGEKLASVSKGKILVSDIWKLLGNEKPTRDEQARMSAAMTSLGWNRDRLRRDGRQQYCYVLGDVAEGDADWIKVIGTFDGGYHIAVNH